MSVCTFIASDVPLPEAVPSREYPLEIDIDSGTIYDGGADDNFFLNTFTDAADYTDKKYGVCLQWHYTEGRARQIIKYIKTALQKTDTVEFWHVWLLDYYEFEDRPFIHKKTVSIDDVTEKMLEEVDSAPVWNRPDKMYPDRPSFYCLTITK